MDFEDVKKKAKDLISDVTDARRARENREGAEQADDSRRQSDHPDEGRVGERAGQPPAGESSSGYSAEASRVGQENRHDQPSAAQNEQSDRVSRFDEGSPRGEQRAAAPLAHPADYETGAGARHNDPADHHQDRLRALRTDSDPTDQTYGGQSHRDRGGIGTGNTVDSQSHERGGTTSPTTAARVAAEPGVARTESRSESREQLVPAGRADSYGARWDALKGNFVDEPRQAVAQADALVGELLDELEQLFREQRRSIEHGLDTDQTDTEDLRMALRRYRSFFDRLLSL